MARAREREPDRHHGVLVIDKPFGLGSTDVVRTVRRAARQRSVGHTGTLDPWATGVLVVCVGRATRLVRFLQQGVKVYEAGIRLGLETSSQDAQGETVAERSAVHVAEDDLRAALAGLTGDILQIPPMVSAVKVGGERLYEMARRGEEVDRQARPVRVETIDVLDFEPGERAHATIRVTCHAGTYVRTLAHDAGRILGCGASLTSLRRQRNGVFDLTEAHDLDAVVRAGEEDRLGDLLVAPVDAVREMPTVEVDLDQARLVTHGRALPPLGTGAPTAVVLRRGNDADDLLLAVYSDRDGDARAEIVLASPAEIA